MAGATHGSCPATSAGDVGTDLLEEVTICRTAATIAVGGNSRLGSRGDASGDAHHIKQSSFSPDLSVSVSGGNAVGDFRTVISAAVLAGILLSGCTSTPPATTPSPSAPVGASPADSPVSSASPEPTSESTSTATTKNQPVPKVQRSGAASPTIVAKPAGTGGKVSYSDGVALRIRNVTFGKETREGPGQFPGRAYAVLELEIRNGSKQALSLDTVVVTVLNKAGNQVNPVYTDEAKVADFSGELKAGATAKAAYAFAVPKSSRNKVTVVVDFDGVHTSAVFRGGLT
ncbi:MAG: DUF4352 domain-containing protein [Micropruina sp.]|uniref:DUF4352 domain-containing protein n=1 Tax=Micropruina sp. TaxID=2737536 RepID=UPI0039E2BF7E